VSGGSFASQSDQSLHFGLGTATKVDQLEIIWPDGRKELLNNPGIDRTLTVAEGKGVVK
jgi:hypothetical protein